MKRAEAVKLAQQCAKAKPESYYSEPFKPHAWVVDAILEAAESSEQQLVEFFRNEGHMLGTEGDDARRTPVEQAIHSMRELLKIRREVERARQGGKMRLAVPESCSAGHLYYRESHAATECPYCLKVEASKLRSIVERARGYAAELWGFK